MKNLHLWGIQAIALGSWELAAYTTRRAPTITTTVRMCHGRYGRRTDLAVTLWLIGLGMHLLGTLERECA